MPRGRISLTVLFVSFTSPVALAPIHAAAPETPLQFQIAEGRGLNAFYQHGPVAAHLLLTSGSEPRVLVAFPAGNSGVGVWFERSTRSVQWKLGSVTGVSRPDARSRTLHGISAEVSVDAPLIVREAVLSSVRVLRDYQINGTYPPEMKSAATVEASSIEWARARLDGAAGYVLSVTVENGTVQRGTAEGAGTLTLSPARREEPLRLRITALTGETPLTPLRHARLLGAGATADARSRQVLEFLSYEEKFLAGSWRFNTYFGRDTLMSLRLLMPSLQRDAVERGLASVLQRLNANGEVAHEEDIGEFAVLRHRSSGVQLAGRPDTPIYDYNMIDDDFMLAPVAAAYAFEQTRDKVRTAAFLASELPNGERVGAALARNFIWVMRCAGAFSRKPVPAHLVSLREGLNAGQWRDSQQGLAGGRYPYDVNAVFVPAALTAIEQFARSGVLQPYLTEEQHAFLATAADAAAVWSREAPPLFRVRLTEAEVRRRISAYAAELGVDAASALAAVPRTEWVVNAIALDGQHQPIPVMHSDGGFALLLQNPPALELERIVGGMLRPFPAGLLTDAGLLVANPVFADATRRQQLGNSAYHGTVIWSWQQALFAAGLERQAARRDLPAATLDHVAKARAQLWTVIENTRALRSSELWSWRFAGNKYQAVPFGQNSGDADESNAAQLWSTVYLSIAK